LSHHLAADLKRIGRSVETVKTYDRVEPFVTAFVAPQLESLKKVSDSLNAPTAPARLALVEALVEAAARHFADAGLTLKGSILGGPGVRMENLSIADSRRVRPKEVLVSGM
jgi:hypothetical protein